MDWAALLTAVITLVLAVMDHRRATAPQRAQHDLEADYDADVQQANAALTHGDANALTHAFEEERQDGIRRGDLEPGPGSDRMRGGYAGNDQQ